MRDAIPLALSPTHASVSSMPIGAQCTTVVVRGATYGTGVPRASEHRPRPRDARTTLDVRGRAAGGKAQLAGGGGGFGRLLPSLLAKKARPLGYGRTQLSESSWNCKVTRGRRRDDTWPTQVNAVRWAMIILVGKLVYRRFSFTRMDRRQTNRQKAEGAGPVGLLCRKPDEFNYDSPLPPQKKSSCVNTNPEQIHVWTPTKVQISLHNPLLYFRLKIVTSSRYKKHRVPYAALPLASWSSLP